MPLGIKKEAFLLNESDKQRLIEPLYKLYETTQKQHEPHRVRVMMLVKKNPTKNGRKGGRTQISDISNTQSAWNWLFSSIPVYLCFNMVRPTSCFNGIWKPAALKSFLEFI